MRRRTLSTICGLLFGSLFLSTSLWAAKSKEAKTTPVAPVFNREPLVPKDYAQLPLGAIRADGWLLEQLHRQQSGLTGHLDEAYPEVVGPRNCWLGGDGDAWERGPYWVDGLLPLAYLLDDDALKAKARPWVEWTLSSQLESGQFGPVEDRPYEAGLQRDNAQDWWPRMVVLKILQQYYMATGDERVLTFMTRYFRYQLSELPRTPLGRWTFWAEQRGGDNTQVVLWLYNLTGDTFLLELADLLHEQSTPWTNIFLHEDHLRRQLSLHCVNLGQGMKEPVVHYQKSGDPDELRAPHRAFDDIRQTIGLPTGLWGGDELLRYGEPTTGSELCTAVETMFSLESMLEITGDTRWADQLERIAYNALPTQVTDAYDAKQYYQQVNQVEVTPVFRNFSTPHDETDILFGTRSGYVCCLCNMHQGWPKLTQNLVYATADGGLAALVYAPCHATATLPDGTSVTLTEQTEYPFGERVDFTVSFGTKKQREATFPLHLRVPGWCRDARLLVNGEPYQPEDHSLQAGTIVRIPRTWHQGDRLTLELSMDVRTSRWYDGGAVVERGPLVYALKMKENWTRRDFGIDRRETYDSWYYEVTSDSPWAYGLTRTVIDHPAEHIEVVKSDAPLAAYPWNPEGAPVILRTRALPMRDWSTSRGSAAQMTYFTQQGRDYDDEQPIELIPYGCTTLRVAVFPVR